MQRSHSQQRSASITMTSTYTELDELPGYFTTLVENVGVISFEDAVVLNTIVDQKVGVFALQVCL
jgi:hypothetical protein